MSTDMELRNIENAVTSETNEFYTSHPVSPLHLLLAGSRKQSF